MSDDVGVRFTAQIDDLTQGIADIKAQLATMDAATSQASQTFSKLGEQIKTGADAAPIERAKTALDDLQKAGDVSANGVAKLGGQFDSLNKIISSGGTGGSSDWLKSLLGGGAVAAGIAGILDLVTKVNSEMRDMTRNAEETGLSLQRIQELKYAANRDGVDNSKFVSDLQAAAGKLNDLAHGANDLSKFLDANNEKYKKANGELISTNDYLNIAASLIQRAGTEGDKFKAASMFGLSREWVQVLQGGPAALQRAAQEAHTTGAVLDDELVSKAAAMEKEWDASTLRWSNYFKSLIVSITPVLSKTIDTALSPDFWSRVAGNAKAGFAEIGEVGENFGDHFDFSEGIKNAKAGVSELGALWDKLWSKSDDAVDKLKTKLDDLPKTAAGLAQQLAPAVVDISNMAERFSAVVAGTEKATTLADGLDTVWRATSADVTKAGAAVQGFLSNLRGTGPSVAGLMTGFSAGASAATTGIGNLDAAWKKVQEDADRAAEAAKRALAASAGGGSAGPKTVFPSSDDKGDKDATRAALETSQENIRLIDLKYEEEVSKIESSQKIFAGSEAAKTAALLAALQKRSDAEQTELSKQLDIAKLSETQCPS